ncbi:hypothetical protein HYH03_005812 [Edaphochlamys debaryana]|uniref:Uncharacterized protein n=1 Tax=Edaphochlamys debaryana TaxID=47281 RepID=A0A835Y6U2_9CHLO|nr:hypothetical protein HYH03_005812 [Edaphochlamys debaryana]|eukprot:KAG2496214.1 hypothetical protein HYH03_005812 [Edaphochlamys debaryana]
MGANEKRTLVLHYGSKVEEVRFFARSSRDDLLTAIREVLGVAAGAPLRFRDEEGAIMLFTAGMPSGTTLTVSVEQGGPANPAPAAAPAPLGALAPRPPKPKPVYSDSSDSSSEEEEEGPEVGDEEEEEDPEGEEEKEAERPVYSEDDIPLGLRARPAPAARPARKQAAAYSDEDDEDYASNDVSLAKKPAANRPAGPKRTRY